MSELFIALYDLHSALLQLFSCNLCAFFPCWFNAPFALWHCHCWTLRSLQFICISFCSCMDAINLSTEVGERGTGLEPAHVREGRDALCKIFRSELYKLECIDVTVNFIEELLPQRARPAIHGGILCISKETNARGQLLSIFATGQLFVRQAVPEPVVPLPTSDYVNPATSNLDFGMGHRVTGQPALGEDALLKQWISGVNFYVQVRVSCHLLALGHLVVWQIVSWQVS